MNGGHNVTRSGQQPAAKAKPSRRWPAYLTWFFAIFALAAPTIANQALGLGVAPVLSGSMRPLVTPGDLFITRATPATALRVGQIISAQNPTTGVLFAHRIVSIHPYNGLLRIVTKGDANPSLDRDPVLLARNATVQRTVGYAKWLGTPLIFLTSKSGVALGTTLMIGANVLALLLFVLQRTKRKEKKAPERIPHPADESWTDTDTGALMREYEGYITSEGRIA